MYARTRPRVLNYFAVPGSPSRLYRVPKALGHRDNFRSVSKFHERSAGHLQGRIHLAILPFAAVRGPAHAGQVRLLAVTNEQRTPAAPEVPTVAQAGFPDFTFGGLLGLFGPKDMRAELRERVASEVRDVLGEPEVKKHLSELGLVARGTSASEFSRILDEQRNKWAAIALEHEIKPKNGN